MGHIICISNQKGGTGKTTTAVNLAASLALFEKKTLLVDCDPMGNATTHLGIDKKALSLDLHDALLQQAPLAAVTVETDFDCLKVVPSRFELLRIGSMLSESPQKERLLRLLLEKDSENYDFIIIDSPASMGLLSVSSMVAADWVLIPMQLQLHAVEGLGQMLRVIGYIQKRYNAKLKIIGILLTMAKRDTGTDSPGSQIQLNRLNNTLLKTRIPWDLQLQASSNHFRPLVFDNLASQGARAHLDLATEILTMLRVLRDFPINK